MDVLKDLEFFLPDKFKGLTKDYIIECCFDKEIQSNWQPRIGDIIVGKTGNVFVISAKHSLIDELGGDLFFFGGGLCSRDGGSLMNTTQSYMMNNRGFVSSDFKEQVSKINDFFYVPYPHENEKLTIEIPEGYYNIGVANNILVADTNNSANWDVLRIALPKGSWSVYSVRGTKVVLKKT